jgi:hypothetical protein
MSDIYWCVPVTYILACTMKVCVCLCVCACDCGLPLALFQVEFKLGCLFSPHHVNQGGFQRLPRKSLFTSPTLLKSLSGDADLAGTVRYCLAMRVNRGNSCWCPFHHHMRGPVHDRASDLGIRAVKLPVSEHLKLQVAQVLTMNQDNHPP